MSTRERESVQTELEVEERKLADLFDVSFATENTPTRELLQRNYDLQVKKVEELKKRLTFL